MSSEADEKNERFKSLFERVRQLRKVDPVKARQLHKQLKRRKRKQLRREQDSTEKPREKKESTALLETDASEDGIRTEEIEYVPVDFDEMLEATSTSQAAKEELRSVIEKFRELEAQALLKSRESDAGYEGGGDEDDDPNGEYYDITDPNVDMDVLENLSGVARVKRLEEIIRNKGPDKGDDDDEDEEEDDIDENGSSKKKIKLVNRPTVAQLKKLTRRPEVVEVWDATAPDPGTLVILKGYRNTVPVPPHWSYKRKYLQGKRGIEKVPYKLPPYIEATRIAEIRAAIAEKDAQKTLKQKQREKVRPRLHKMDIDYQVLHDAFFKYATKPPLTKFGDVYFEGKELEQRMRKFKPGQLSERAREALGIPSENNPPPWLYNMQRYGPPRSYPNLRVPGVNAPIPPGAETGFHNGGWGKPPTEEQLGQWGLVDGMFDDDDAFDRRVVSNEVNKLWGEVQEVESSDDEEEMEDLTADLSLGEVPPLGGTDTPLPGAGTTTPFDSSGIASVNLIPGGARSVTSGVTSVTSGLGTPASVDLRGRGFLSSGMAAGTKPYTILEQKSVPAQPGALFTSTTVYQVPQPKGGVGGAETPGGIGGAVSTFNLVGLGGTVTPVGFGGGLATPLGLSGTTSTASGLATPGGTSALDMQGLITPMGGVAAGSGVTVSLNPSDMEQEGVFAAEVIRQQLKQHAEASQRAHQMAGLVEPNVPKEGAVSSKTVKLVKKGGSSTTNKEEKKKKKTFKF